MGKLATLLLLYFAEGLPFGFQVTALPLLLRERGVSLQAIGFAGVLALPWMAKALWAPWVDRFGSDRFGRRKTWIVPLQIALTVTAAIAGRVEGTGQLLAFVFLLNLFAATMDIAVDALAVSLIRPDQLGIVNSFQVIGYKLGMLTGGGLLLWASSCIGYRGMFDAMAALMLVISIVALSMKEPRASESSAPTAASEQWTMREIWLQLKAAMFDRATLPLIIVIVTYKMGETLADGMWKPLLFDKGFKTSDIGLWNGTYGMFASFVGSLLAGIWSRSRPLAAMLTATALFRALGIAAEWWVSVAHVGDLEVIVVSCIEHFFGGAITTVVFALMMRHTRRAIGGTHYTLLASLEVWGKSSLGAVSGVIAAGIGYPALFGLATGLSVAFAGLAIVLRGRLTAADGEPIALQSA
jgi:PAT family beta-lactamase induction signal transducer AmpG